MFGGESQILAPRWESTPKTRQNLSCTKGLRTAGKQLWKRYERAQHGLGIDLGDVNWGKSIPWAARPQSAKSH